MTDDAVSKRRMAALPPHPSPDPAPRDRSADADWTSQITAVAIVHLDVDGNITRWNPGAERLKGYSAEEVLGTSFTRFYRDEERTRGLPAALLAIAAARGSVEDTGWRVRASGEQFWAHVIITALHDDEGEIDGYVKIVTDLSVAKRREDSELAFLRSFAHDFLSPITALRGYVDLLLDPTLGTGHALERLVTVTEHLSTMMEGLSNRLAASTPAASASVVDVVDVVREAAEIVLPGDAYGRLRYHGASSLSVWAEPVSLRRAIANLIDNAAKYSADAIDISVDADGDGALVTITDHGRGIASEDLGSIFDPLERGRLSDPDDGGTGIGLASAKALLEQQSGSVSIDSAVGVGTSVVVRLTAVEGLRPAGTDTVGASSSGPGERTAAAPTGSGPSGEGGGAAARRTSDEDRRAGAKARAVAVLRVA
ncbi:PAS domain-containing sensor histidine kinase [Microbacterium sp. 18062]|uniref:PAS domain-containing sensor histidine kinase n=1 Tax=Microbacterium sp. 18062 TaxID=2681410 RepID=UPI001356F83E|nr:PAS domain-containing sensor histidine kinase [Microbacterium sp. 18062]